MASRSRTSEFIRCRERARGNRRTNKSIELKELKVDRSLLKQHTGHSDDETSSIENACSITVPPLWMTVVEDLNRDITSIRTKRARSSRFRASPSPTPARGADRAPGRPRARARPAKWPARQSTS